MQSTSLPPTLSPRLLRLGQTAAYLGLSPKAMTTLLPQLKKSGFPDPLSLLGLWDRHVIDAWLDQVSGLSAGRIGFHPPAQFVIGSPRAPVKRFASPPTQAKRHSAENYTVVEVADAYMAWFREHRRTIKTTHYCLSAKILPAFGSRTIASLTTQELRAWHEGLANTPRSMRVAYGQPRRYYPRPTLDDEKRRRRSTANRCLSVFKAVLNKAFKDGIVPSDAVWRAVGPFTKVIISKADYLTVDECRKLIPHLAPDFRDFVRAALFTGARFTELAELTAGEVNVVAGTIYIAPSKTARSRHVILTDEGKAYFAAKVRNLTSPDLVFRRSDGEPWRLTDPYPRLYAACQLSGVKRISFHGLRHTYASILVMQGTPIPVVAKNLGHNTSDACERYYAHLAPNYISDTIREKMPVLGITEDEGDGV